MKKFLLGLLALSIVTIANADEKWLEEGYYQFQKGAYQTPNVNTYFGTSGEDRVLVLIFDGYENTKYEFLCNNKTLVCTRGAASIEWDSPKNFVWTNTTDGRTWAFRKASQQEYALPPMPLHESLDNTPPAL